MGLHNKCLVCVVHKVVHVECTWVQSNVAANLNDLNVANHNVLRENIISWQVNWRICNADYIFGVEYAL